MAYPIPPLPKLTSSSAQLPIPLMQLPGSAFHPITSLHGKPMRENTPYFVEEVFRSDMTLGWQALETIMTLSEAERRTYRENYSISIRTNLPPFMEQVDFNKRIYTSVARALAVFLESLRETYPHIRTYMEEIPKTQDLLEMLKNPRYVLNGDAFREMNTKTFLPEKQKLRSWRNQPEHTVHHDIGKTIQKIHFLAGLDHICSNFSSASYFEDRIPTFPCLWDGIQYCLQTVPNRDACTAESEWIESFHKDSRSEDFKGFFYAWASAIETIILNTFDDDKLHEPRLL